eukprot:397338-Pleurochrysis_carterae.AAC.2
MRDNHLRLRDRGVDPGAAALLKKSNASVRCALAPGRNSRSEVFSLGCAKRSDKVEGRLSVRKQIEEHELSDGNALLAKLCVRTSARALACRERAKCARASIRARACACEGARARAKARACVCVGARGASMCVRVCVCARVRARVRASVRVRVRVRVRAWACACVRACVRGCVAVCDHASHYAHLPKWCSRCGAQGKLWMLGSDCVGDGLDRTANVLDLHVEGVERRRVVLATKVEQLVHLRDDEMVRDADKMERRIDVMKRGVDETERGADEWSAALTK